MSLASFLDVVWAEIWDDCSPMGDRTQHRDIVHKMFIQGIPPWQITYKDAKGRVRHLASTPDITRPAPKHQRDEAMELFKKIGGVPRTALGSTDDG